MVTRAVSDPRAADLVGAVEAAIERTLPRLADALAEPVLARLADALRAARQQDLQTILLDDLFTALIERSVEKALLRADARRAKIDDANEIRRASTEGGEVWRDQERTKNESSDPIVTEVDGVSRSSMLKASELVFRARAKKKPGK